MGRNPIRAKSVLDAGARSKLESIAKSRTEGQARIERAKVLLAYHAGERVAALAEAFDTNRPKIELRHWATSALPSAEAAFTFTRTWPSFGERGASPEV